MPELMQLEAWGNVHDLCIEAGTYAFGGGLFLQLYEVHKNGEMEPYSNLTVNLPGLGESGSNAYIDINNFPEAEALISEYGLGKPTGKVGHSGYCIYPEYKFDLSKAEKYCLNPEELKKHKTMQKERNEAR